MKQILRILYEDILLLLDFLLWKVFFSHSQDIYQKILMF